MRRFWLGALLLMPTPVIAAFYSATFWRTLGGGVAAMVLIWLAAAALRMLPERLTPGYRGVILGWGAAFAGFLLSVLELSSFVLSGESFNFAYYYHFRLSTLLIGSAGYVGALILGAVWIVGTGAALFWVLKKPFPLPESFSCRRRQLLAAGALPLCLAGLAVLPAAPRHAYLLWRQVHAPLASELPPANVMLRYGIKPPAATLDALTASPGKNLVFIYLESMENSYLDETRYPGLLPNMQRFIREGIFFSEVHQARHAGFTFGGLFSSQSGGILTNAHMRGDSNDGFNAQLGSRLPTLPRILKKAGYTQQFIQGSSLSFAGMDVFLGGETYDLRENVSLLKEHRALRDTMEWGVRDGLVFKRVLERYKMLGAAGKPFQMSVMTIDGHSPAGLLAPGVEPYQGRSEPNTLLTAHHNTDRELGKLIDAMRSTPYWRDTVVVLLTDHLALRNILSDELEKNPDRKLIFLALNTGRAPGRIAVPGKTFDVAPTVLELLGVRHNGSFPLGESLLGAPDERRLLGDAEEAESVLSSYLRYFSDSQLPERYAVQVRTVPYPALLIGSAEVPLYLDNWGWRQLPTGTECFAVRVDGANQLRESLRWSNAAGFLKWRAQAPGDTYILLTTTANIPALGLPPASGQFFLLQLIRGDRVITRGNPEADRLSFSGGEVASMQLEGKK